MKKYLVPVLLGIEADDAADAEGYAWRAITMLIRPGGIVMVRIEPDSTAQAPNGHPLYEDGEGPQPEPKAYGKTKLRLVEN